MVTRHRPSVGIVFFFCAGIVIERYGTLPLWVWPSALMLVLAGAFFVRYKRWVAMSVIGAVCLCSGAMALRSYVSLPPEHIARLIGQEGALKGRVVSDVSDGVFAGRPRESFVIAAREFTGRGSAQHVSGRVLVTVFRAVDVELGDEVLLSGRLRRPSGFGGNTRLSYVDTLAGRKVLAAVNVKKDGELKVLSRGQIRVWESWARACRDWLSGGLGRYLSPGEAGLMKGLIYGDRSNITEHVKNIFLRTGTTHILAVSGMNVAMVAFGIFFALGLLPVPRLPKMFLAIALTAWYAYVAGGSSPVVRAAVMSAVFILSFALEREQDGLNTLAVASMVILAVNPTQLFDVGFQLSFAGVLSLMLVAPLLGGLFPEGGRKLWQEYLGVSIAAFFGTAGIVLYYFGSLSTVSLLANIPAVPLVGVITALGTVFFLFCGIPWLAAPVALALKVALNLLVYLLYLFTLIPGGFFYVTPLPALWQVALYYICLLVLLIGPFRRHDRGVRIM